MTTMDDLSWGGAVCVGIAAAIALHHLASEVIGGLAVPVPRRVDPADRMVWDVLDEARRILEEPDPDAAG